MNNPNNSTDNISNKSASDPTMTTRRALLLIVLMLLLMIICGFVVRWHQSSLRESVNSSEATANSFLTHAGQVNPYREVLEYYQAATEVNTYDWNKNIIDKIEASMSDGELSITELWVIRDIRKEHLERLALTATQGGSAATMLKAYQVETSAPISEDTVGVYQKLHDYQQAISEMPELDAATKSAFIARVKKTVIDGAADMNTDSEEYRDIEASFYDLREGVDKKRLLSMIKDKQAQ